jgi:hypothetical protein
VIRLSKGTACRSERNHLHMTVGDDDGNPITQPKSRQTIDRRNNTSILYSPLRRLFASIAQLMIDTSIRISYAGCLLLLACLCSGEPTGSGRPAAVDSNTKPRHCSIRNGVSLQAGATSILCRPGTCAARQPAVWSAPYTCIAAECT